MTQLAIGCYNKHLLAVQPGNRTHKTQKSHLRYRR